jgi:hypothetical protein
MADCDFWDVGPGFMAAWDRRPWAEVNEHV